VHKRIISAVRRVEFVSDRMSYTILRGSWDNIIDLNVRAPRKDTSDDVKDSFYEEIGRLSDQFPRYYTKILLGNFIAKVGREDILKPTIGIIKISAKAIISHCESKYHKPWMMKNAQNWMIDGSRLNYSGCRTHAK
jgi:hypothetical protein